MNKITMPVCGGEINNSVSSVLSISEVHPQKQAETDLCTQGFHKGIQGHLTPVI